MTDTRVKLSATGLRVYGSRRNTAYRHRDHLSYRATLLRAPYNDCGAWVVKVQRDDLMTPTVEAAALWEPITEEEKCFV